MCRGPVVGRSVMVEELMEAAVCSWSVERKGRVMGGEAGEWPGRTCGPCRPY